MTLEDARRVIAADEKKAKEIGQPMNIAVGDEGGNLVSHVRMDGAWLGSIHRAPLTSLQKIWPLIRSLADSFSEYTPRITARS